MDDDQELLERIRSRLEQDADVLRWTDRKARHQLLRRVAQLAAEEAHAEPRPATWETARTRPLATPELDDPRDVLIGRLARVLDAADGGHHSASYDALLAAASTASRSQGPPVILHAWEVVSALMAAAPLLYSLAKWNLAEDRGHPEHVKEAASSVRYESGRLLDQIADNALKSDSASTESLSSEEVAAVREMLAASGPATQEGRSQLRNVAMIALRLTVITASGGAAGPAIAAHALGESVVDEIIKGSIAAFTGGVAAEALAYGERRINASLDKSDRAPDPDQAGKAHPPEQSVHQGPVSQSDHTATPARATSVPLRRSKNKLRPRDLGNPPAVPVQTPRESRPSVGPSGRTVPTATVKGPNAPATQPGQRPPGPPAGAPRW